MSSPEPCYHWHPPRWLVFVGAFLAGGCIAAAHATSNQPLSIALSFIGGGIGTLFAASSGGFAHRRSSDLPAVIRLPPPPEN